MDRAISSCGGKPGAWWTLTRISGVHIAAVEAVAVSETR
jgi:hypothetical protein